jgi:CO/xanthine dehydrogenase FAD-binding subunit
MIPATFDYVRPASLADATRILLEHDGEAVLMSGGPKGSN